MLISDILHIYFRPFYANFRRFFRYRKDKVFLVLSVLFGANIHTRASVSFDKVSANPPGFFAHRAIEVASIAETLVYAIQNVM